MKDIDTTHIIIIVECFMLLGNDLIVIADEEDLYVNQLF